MTQVPENDGLGYRQLYRDQGFLFNANVNQIAATGDIVAFYSSDERLKDNIAPIPNALDKILSISGNTFEWNNEEHETGHVGEDTGVIAQEIEALGLPGLVTTRKDGYKAVKYEKLTALLIEAVKELSAKVSDLEEKLKDK